MLPDPSTGSVTGSARPRIAPPVPVRTDLKAFKDVAKSIDIELMSWQEEAARYIEAIGPDGRHQYREVAIVVARQNGKTSLLRPLIVKRLREGKRVMHTAQNRELPREVHAQLADVIPRHELKRAPRFANGQEEIRMRNGGLYRIVAATRGGARGPSNDLVIIDELREMDAWDFMAAAKPTLTASKDPQTVYLSNAGDDTSVVLNSLRARAEQDPRLAYLEWSAAPDRTADDREGWAEANPAIGDERPEMGSILETLEDEHRAAQIDGTMAIFETEHLCRWVLTMRELLVSPAAWALCEVPELPPATKVSMGVSMDPSGTRAAAAAAWQNRDGSISLQLLFNVTGEPIDVAMLGRDMNAEAQRRKVRKVAFDPMTDVELSKYFRVTESVNGLKWANASSLFVNLIEAGRLKWMNAHAVGEDLTWTARKPNEQVGSFAAVRANDDRPVPAALAAIRAVWLASGPTPPRARIG